MSSKAKVKRILYVSQKGGFFGGVERFIYDTAEALNNCDFAVFGMFAEPARQFEPFCAPFRKVYSFDDRAEIMALNFDAVFIHKLSDFELLRMLNSRFRTVLYVHDHDYYCRRRHKYFPFKRKNCSLPGNRPYCLLCSILVKENNGKLKLNWDRNFSKVFREIRRCSRFAVMSEYMRHNLTVNGFRCEDISKIYTIIDTPDAAVEKSCKRKTPVIVAVGQLIAGKGFDLLLNALNLLDFDFKAYIVGGGKDEKYLRNLCLQKGLQTRVEFTGWQDQVAEYYREADIAVFPSRWQEPFGLTGVEAAAYGLPVVGFDVGGVSEWLRDGHNGFLVAAGDTAAMAEAIKRLALEPEKALALGKNGRNFIKSEFSVNKFIEAFEAIIA
ncbi:glycosyltransferase family 4 protein [Lentisphaerota bacterium ZTH]|nr:glycosyltransferase family 4 protein [Lentisphaerota bacterium]WET07390.1 glycosyltransferase family 4 protein [Lentisphaerota bacterium ZTH]